MSSANVSETVSLAPELTLSSSTTHSVISFHVILYILIAFLGFFVIILFILLGWAILNCFFRMVQHEPVNKVLYYITA